MMTDPAAPPPSISDLGLLGDRRTAALVTRTGEVVWYCPGRFDAPALLGRLLDAERGGSWRVEPQVRPAGRRYLGDSGVLETRLGTPDGEWTLTDFLPYGAGLPRGLCRRLSPAPRAYRLVLRPAPNYGQRPAVLVPEDGGAVRVDDRHWLLGSHPLTAGDGEVVMAVPPGEAAWAVLADERCPAVDAETVAGWQAQTLAAWEELARTAPTHGPHADAVRASLRALRLLTDERGGGTVAAPTTSLPEVIGGPLNWDYRYVWLRDAGMVVSALTRAGDGGREGRRFLDFICGCAPRGDGLPLAPFVTVDGEDAPRERELDLAGYRGSRPVRVGNGARHQLQLDAYGNVLLAAKLLYERFGRAHWPVVERLADFLQTHWAEDDFGVWEERRKRPYVAGKVLAACALEYVAPYGTAEQARRWRAAAADIRRWVQARALTREGAYAYVAGGQAVDVTAALYPVWGYCAADSPEMRATLQVLERDSCRNGLYWRHLEDAPGRPEGAFLAGTFWVAQYWVMRDPARARPILAAALACANDLGLLPEEADAHTGEARGNFPQTFVHAALIGAVTDLWAAPGQQAD